MNDPRYTINDMAREAGAQVLSVSSRITTTALLQARSEADVKRAHLRELEFGLAAEVLKKAALTTESDVTNGSEVTTARVVVMAPRAFSDLVTRAYELGRKDRRP